MPEGLCDQELMARLAGGDHESFHLLFLRHQKRVFRLAFRQTGNRLEAEEIVQETFVRLLRSAARYRAEASFETYLLTIATRLCLNAQARAYKRFEEPHRMDEPRIINVAASTPGPEDAALGNEIRSAVRRVILSLPDEERMALVLFRFEGLSYEDAARAMGKTVSAVTSLLWRARERLREGLKEWIDDAAVPSQDRRRKPV